MLLRNWARCFCCCRPVPQGFDCLHVLKLAYCLQNFKSYFGKELAVPEASLHRTRAPEFSETASLYLKVHVRLLKRDSDRDR